MGKKKKSNTLKDFGGIGLGLGKATVGIGVSAAVAGHAASSSPLVAPALGGFSTLASGAGVATTALVGGSVLGSVRKLNKKNKYKY